MKLPHNWFRTISTLLLVLCMTIGLSYMGCNLYRNLQEVEKQRQHLNKEMKEVQRIIKILKGE